jgi:hypothetical protein
MIKQIIPNLLYFDTGNFVKGEQKGRGYYFKGVFISKYKSILIDTMRDKFKEDFSDENKKKYADEFAVIHYFYEISKKATQSTYEKKKEYYAERRKITEIGNVQREITRLELTISKLEKQKNDLEALKNTYQENLNKLRNILVEQVKQVGENK